jgi:tRNA (mo5U34)-methyltransferase
MSPFWKRLRIAVDERRRARWLARGNAAQAAGQWETAAGFYERSPATRFEHALVWVLKGRQLAGQGKSVEAEGAFNRAIEVNPHFPMAFFELGRLFLKQNDRPRAKDCLLGALRRGSERQEELVGLLRRLGAEAEAREIIADEDRYPLDGRIQSYFWWHSIDLGSGLTTPGHISAARMAIRHDETFGPLALEGKSVLDVGTWNGGFSVEAARRGAARVVGLDHATWHNPLFRGRCTFDLVNRATGLRIEPQDVDLDDPRLDLGPLGSFDIVLFLGVFYHLRNPLSALREVANRATEVLVVETHIQRTISRRPSMRFYPADELNADPSNWWGPNEACMLELLKGLGFPRIDVSNGSGWDRKVFHAYRRPSSPDSSRKA